MSKLFGEALTGYILPSIGFSSMLDEEFKTEEDYQSYQEAMLQGGLLGVFNHWSNLDESSIIDIQQVSRGSDFPTNTNITRQPAQNINDTFQSGEVTINSSYSNPSSDSLIDNSNIQIARNNPRNDPQPVQQRQGLQNINFGDMLSGNPQINSLVAGGLTKVASDWISNKNDPPQQPIINVNVNNPPQEPPVVNVNLKQLMESYKLEGLDRHHILASTLNFN